MRILHPASEKVASGGRQLRDRILENYYVITPHADRRMAERRITLRDVINCIKNGSMASAKEKKDGQFCIDFYHGPIGNELIVAVRATFGDYNAKPMVVTAYHNNAEEYLPEGELDDLVEPVFVQKIITKAPDDMTDEELENELSRRREERNKKAKQDLQRKIHAIQSQRAQLFQERSRLETAIAKLDSELATYETTTEKATMTCN